MTTQIKRTRTANLAGSKIDEANRTVEVAFSSNAEVDRGGFVEILSHERGAMDTHRLEGGAAVLVDHNWSDHVGVVESISIDSVGGVGRAVLRFGNSERAKEVFQDIVDGIRRHISFGYIIHEEQKLEGRRGVEVTNYEPYEISIVSVPADVTVGVGRDAEPEPIPAVLQTEEPQTAEPEQQPEPENTNQVTNKETEDHQMADTVQDAVKAERERSAKIRQLGQKFGLVEEAEQAIEEGTTVERFAFIIGEKAPDAMAARGVDPDTDAGKAGITQKDLSEYSLARAVKAAATNDWSKAGLEREISLTLADQRGRDAQERGFIVPHEALVSQISEREQNTGNSGQITPVIYRPDMFIDLLRDSTILGRLGGQMLTGLTGTSGIDIPAQLSDVDAQWIGEGDSADDKSVAFGTVSLSPSTLAVAVPITRRVRLQSNPLIDRIIQRSIMYAMARGLDHATFHGDGSTNVPIGILNADREKEAADKPANKALGVINKVTNRAGDSMIPDWKTIVEMETLLDELNFEGGSIHYLMNKATRGELKTTMKEKSTGNTFGWIMPGNNELNGHNAIAHNLFKKGEGGQPDGSFLFGDFSAAMWGFWSSVDFRVDTAAKSASDGIVLRAFQDCGFELERNSAFVKLEKGAAS